MLTVASTLREECLSPADRFAVLGLLRRTLGDAHAAESAIHARSLEREDDYRAHARRVIFNLECNATLASKEPSTLVFMTDEELAAGTVVENIQK